MIVLAISLTGKSLGIPTRARKPEEARVLLDRHLEVRDAIEKRYNAGIQLWLIGLVCVALSALVQSFGSK